MGENGLRHCVRLGKIREIESEFSRIGVRMKEIWTNEVRQKNPEQARTRMHWRTCEVRQYKNRLAHLGSAPVPSQETCTVSREYCGWVHQFGVWAWS